MNNNDDPNLNRRVFLKGLGYVSLGLVYSTMFGGCETIIKNIQNRPVRRRLRTGSAEVDAAIAIYKDAVTAMKALPSTNPRSWAAQAALHGSVSGGFNFCQHGTNHFFSWHRAYLFYFEKICQELTGEKSFGLPYWNWNQNHDMHSAFTSGVLDHPRNNTSVGTNTAFSDSTMDTIFSDTNFFTFSSQLEGTPHNTAHVVVGQDMVTGGSPLDPIFWAHHCMVDYSWAKWNIELENDNTNDSAWLNTSWNHFVDGKGNPTTMTAGTTILMPFLSYRYESSAVGGFGAEMDMAKMAAKDVEKVQKRVKEGADVKFDIKKRVSITKDQVLPINQTFSAQTQVTTEDFAALLEAGTRQERVFLNIDYAQLPSDNDFFVRVFINKSDANAQTPISDLHYAGSFAFFGVHAGDSAGHHHKTGFLVNVTETLKKLRANNLIKADEPLAVQLIAIPVKKELTRPTMQLKLKFVDFIVSTVHIKSK